ncbi:MAG: hypothetical protein HQL25_01300 [Candidatus Omnitrophica bacterium]|nr:hypothetical protein [Candidatus Omnitrophota bacterium]
MIISAHIIFYTLVVFGQLIPFFLILINLSILSYLLYQQKQTPKTLLAWGIPNDTILNINLSIFILVLATLLLKASLFPYGGWDAWAIWNLKARFIFLGADQWKNMLDPVLMHTNNHYPFLLPLMNAWIWCFGNTASHWVPLTTSVIFALLLPMLLGLSLYITTKHKFSFIPAFLMAFLPLYQLLSISQYADLLVAFYLLCIFTCFHMANEQKSPSLFFLTGIFCGSISFIKDEGLVSSILIAVLITFSIFTNKNITNEKNKILKNFILGSGLALIPAVFFNIFIRPENLRFINGLTSTSDPTSWQRLLFTIAAYFIEILKLNWQGLWFIILGGILLSFKTLYKTNTQKLIINFLICYLTIITINYFINTHYPISFWINTSLNRILMTLVPTLLFMTFYSIFLSQNKKG